MIGGSLGVANTNSKEIGGGGGGGAVFQRLITTKSRNLWVAKDWNEGVFWGLITK